MHHHIDIYCERLEPGLWAEPVNAITNAAFFVAGIFALKLARDEGAFTKSSGTLISLIFAMGLGSTLFHTFANLWSMALDVLPILLYQIFFLVFYCRYRIALSWVKSAGLLVAFVILIQIMMVLPRDWFNGTLEYVPALIFLIGLGVWHLKNVAQERWILLIAAAIFIASMSFRALDMTVCAHFPLGTHFAWHCLNAVVLYLTARGYVRAS